MQKPYDGAKWVVSGCARFPFLALVRVLCS
jgi:hypothetical protein